MAEIHFVCPKCGQKTKADESMRGQEAECPHCGKLVIVPTGRTASDKKLQNTAVISCPYCGSSYRVTQKEMYHQQKCKVCGKGFIAGAKMHPLQGSQVQKIGCAVGVSVFLAVMLANILFAALTFIVVGNQMEKVSEKLDGFYIPKTSTATLEPDAIRVVIEGTRHLDGAIYRPK